MTKETKTGNSYVEDSKNVEMPRLTYSALLRLLAANKGKEVITVGPGDYKPDTGEISDMPNTDIDGEEVPEVGHTLDGPIDNDHRRRRLAKYARFDEAASSFVFTAAIKIGTQTIKRKYRADSSSKAQSKAQREYPQADRIEIIGQKMS